jgi:two-component system, OmpR family, sensor kinase
MGVSGIDAQTETPPGSPRRLDMLLSRVAELEAQVAARDQLLAIAAHELRNPIHAIGLQIGVAGKMASQRGDRAIADRLQQVDRALQWFLRRCSVMLDLSRMASGTQAFDFGIVDVRDVLRHVEDLYLPQAQLNDSPLHIECHGDLVGKWNSLALEQALGNLLSNAIKFGAGAPVLVTATDTGNNIVKIQVADRGAGISKADQEMMHSDFAELMRNTDVRRGGFGGGLWLARNLLEAHGGYLEVSSASGSGSTFTTYLPKSSPAISASK